MLKINQPFNLKKPSTRKKFIRDIIWGGEKREAKKTIYLGVILILVFGAYPAYFYLALGFDWSKDPQDWGKFGAYTGGVLGPILSFYSIYLLLENIKRDRKIRGDDLEKERLLLQMELAQKSFNELNNDLVNIAKEPLFKSQHLDMKTDRYPSKYSLNDMILFHRDIGYSSGIYLSLEESELFLVNLNKLTSIISRLLQINKVLAECSSSLKVVRFKGSDITIDDVIIIGAAIKITAKSKENGSEFHINLYSHIHSRTEFRRMRKFLIKGQRRSLFKVLKQTNSDQIHW
ncbi:MAG: hypothetical protein K6L60_09735 [Oceanobacter sp.]